MLESEGEVSKPRIDAVEEFVTAAKDYEERTEEPSLSGFMEEVSLVSDVDKYDTEADAVVLMTIHSAKGLEFPVVFLPGMEEGVFPGMQASESPAEMSEERRLAYVAITRAKEELYMTHTVERMLYGRTGSNALSRFVRNEIPKELLDEDASVRRFAPPRAGGWANGGYSSYTSSNRGSAPDSSRSAYAAPATAARSHVYDGSSELNRRVEPVKPRTASSFGVQRFPVGTRVNHPTFGDGTVTELRDMGGDILYRVKFDSGEDKKLMATYARLKKL
jgi:DNA helicase-2/ATP-dependent DNA helicase PcrA